MHQTCRLIQPQESAESPFSQLSEAERAHILEYAGESCTNQQRLILILRYEHGSSFPEIALALKMSQPAAFQMHARALTRLRCALKRIGIRNIHQI